jgi:hypothetical protein
MTELHAPSSVAGAQERDTDHDAGSSLRSVRAAALVFAAYVAIAIPVLLWIGSYRWFLGDEWAFLSVRSVNAHDLLSDYNQHWHLVSMLIYRGLYSLVGLHAYWPYQLVVILLHLTTAVLLRVIMRRVGVGPWIATVAAGTFVLFGPAEDNILWAFQIGFTSSMVLGLGQLILADHDGPIDRRDWWGLGLGFLCIMTSGQVVALVAAVGLACVFRRRWKAAAFHTIPLGAAYVVWFFGTGVDTVINPTGRAFTFREYVRWMTDAAVGLFDALGYFTIIAIALVAMLVAGLLVAGRDEGWTTLVRRAAVPFALLVVPIISMSAAAPSRFAIGEGGARAGRYIGIIVAATLPLLAVAADALVKRYRVLAPFVAAVFLVPIPFNVVMFGDNPLLTRNAFNASRNYVASLPDNPLVTQVPPWVRPNEGLTGQPGATVGWLLQADREGKLPNPTAPLHPLILNAIPLQLGVAQVSLDRPDGVECTQHTDPLALDPVVGEQWYFPKAAAVTRRAPDGGPGSFPIAGVGTVEITLPDLRLLVSTLAPGTTFEICR